MSARDYAIADVEPVPAGTDLYLARIIQGNRGKIVRNAASANNRMGKAARKILADTAERRARERCPIEQAKVFLRKRGFKPVYKDMGTFFVGRHRFTCEKEFMAFARGKGFEG